MHDYHLTRLAREDWVFLAVALIPVVGIPVAVWLGASPGFDHPPRSTGERQVWTVFVGILLAQTFYVLTAITLFVA